MHTTELILLVGEHGAVELIHTDLAIDKVDLSQGANQVLVRQRHLRFRAAGTTTVLLSILLLYHGDCQL